MNKIIEYIPVTATRGITIDPSDGHDLGYCTWCDRNSLSCECDEDGTDD